MSDDLVTDSKILDSIRKKIEEDGDSHIMTDLDTPMSDSAFELSDEDKIKLIEEHFKNIMLVLGLDLNDDSLKGTPYRVAKMYVKELCAGLKYEEKPKPSLFDNKYNYNKMLIEKNITFYSIYRIKCYILLN